MKQFHVNESLLESSGIFEKNIAKQLMKFR